MKLIFHLYHKKGSRDNLKYKWIDIIMLIAEEILVHTNPKLKALFEGYD